MNIIAPVDFSDVTQAVCREAGQLARDRNAHVRLVHVAEPDPNFVGYDAGPDVVRGQVATEYHREHEQLGELAEGMRNSYGVEVTPLLVQGETVASVIELAARHRASYIIMGTHGRSVVYQVLVGSTSEGVLHRASCPVLLVPARPLKDTP